MNGQLTDREIATLAAIRQAHANPRPLSKAEAESFLAFRVRAGVQQQHTVWFDRRGRLVFRIRGHRGADLPYPPFEWRYRKALLAYEKTLGRLARRPPMELAVRSRQARASARANRVLALYPRYQHRGRHASALIAKRLNERQAYVQRILRETFTTENNDSKQ